MLPRPARLLGWSGLLPAAAALAAVLFAPQPLPEFAFRAGALYSGLILSFLGGAWWGLATRAGPERAWPLYLVAVIPSLAALALLIVLNPARLILLGLLIMATLLVDRALVRIEVTPPGWMALRVPLSLALGLLTIALGITAMLPGGTPA
ncbi:DUF3429 domain-containing protein [Thermaurantiacus sp.]